MPVLDILCGHASSHAVEDDVGCPQATGWRSRMDVELLASPQNGVGTLWGPTRG